MKIQGSATAWILGVCLLAGAGEGHTQDSLEKIRLLYSSIGPAQSILSVAREARIFQKHGLESELIYVAAGVRGAQAMLSGEVRIGTFSGGSVVTANLAGGDLVMIASVVNAPTFYLMASPNLRSVQDLKGKKVAVTRFGASSDFVMRLAADKWPVKPDRDFGVIQVGGQPEMLLALKSGSVHAGMLNAEAGLVARKEGFTVLVDFLSSGLAFPTSVVATTRSFIRTREATVKKFVRGFVEAIHFVKTQRAFTIQTWKRFFRNDDVSALNSLYDDYIIRLIPKTPHPSREAVKTILNYVGKGNPRALSAKPEQFIDGRFVEELEREGYMRKLWQ